MKRALRFPLALLALLALAAAGPGAQTVAPPRPPDPKAADQAAPAATQKPAETPQELPDEAKAFNTAMAEKNPLKKVELLEKFIADNPKANLSLLGRARSQVQTSLLDAMKDAGSRYQKIIDTELADAKKTTDTRPMYPTYNSIASRLATAGVYSDDAEDMARKGLAGMDERTYFENRKRAYTAPWQPMRSRRPTGRTASTSHRQRVPRLSRRPGHAAAGLEPLRVPTTAS